MQFMRLVIREGRNMGDARPTPQSDAEAGANYGREHIALTKREKCILISEPDRPMKAFTVARELVGVVKALIRICDFYWTGGEIRLPPSAR